MHMRLPTPTPPPQGAGSRVVATMAKKSVGDLTKADLDGKTVFVRADLNVSSCPAAAGGAHRLHRLLLPCTDCTWLAACPQQLSPHQINQAAPLGQCSCGGFRQLARNKACIGLLIQSSLSTSFLSFRLQVPLDKALNITDDTRIRAAVPTLKYLVDNGAIVSGLNGCMHTAAAGWQGAGARRQAQGTQAAWDPRPEQQPSAPMYG